MCRCGSDCHPLFRRSYHLKERIRMETVQFDALARSIHDVDRVVACLGGLTGGLVAFVPLALSGERAAAKHKRHKQKPKQIGADCPSVPRAPRPRHAPHHPRPSVLARTIVPKMGISPARRRERSAAALSVRTMPPRSVARLRGQRSAIAATVRPGRCASCWAASAWRDSAAARPVLIRVSLSARLPAPC